MRYRDAALKLARLGRHETPRRGRGSHRNWFNPQSQKDTTLPDWGSRDLKIGTPQSAISSWVSTGRTSWSPRSQSPLSLGGEDAAAAARHTLPAITEPICRVPTTSPPSPAMSLVR